LKGRGRQGWQRLSGRGKIAVAGVDAGGLATEVCVGVVGSEEARAGQAGAAGGSEAFGSALAVGEAVRAVLAGGGLTGGVAGAEWAVAGVGGAAGDAGAGDAGRSSRRVIQRRRLGSESSLGGSACVQRLLQVMPIAGPRARVPGLRVLASAAGASRAAVQFLGCTGVQSHGGGRGAGGRLAVRLLPAGRTYKAVKSELAGFMCEQCLRAGTPGVTEPWRWRPSAGLASCGGSCWGKVRADLADACRRGGTESPGKRWCAG